MLSNLFFSSPRATLSEVGNASPSDNTDETNGQHQGSPASSAEHSPDIALNLCRDVKTEAGEEDLSALFADIQVWYSVLCGGHR